MARRDSRAGGFLLMVAILGGFVCGLLSGNTMLGVLAGTVLGVAAAIVLWLVDRRR